MFDSTITVTDGVDTHILNRIRATATGSEYYLNVSATERVYLFINHTVPKDEINESHMGRIDIHHYDSEGGLLRISSAWSVIKTTSGIQEDADSEKAAALLDSFMSMANVTKLVDRES